MSTSQRKAPPDDDGGNEFSIGIMYDPRCQHTAIYSFDDHLGSGRRKIAHIPDCCGEWSAIQAQLEQWGYIFETTVHGAPCHALPMRELRLVRTRMVMDLLAKVAHVHAEDNSDAVTMVDCFNRLCNQGFLMTARTRLRNGDITFVPIIDICTTLRGGFGSSGWMKNAKANFMPALLSRHDLREAIAQAYCTPETENETMNPSLVEAIIKSIEARYAPSPCA